jgi:hypothetical protein
MGRSAAPRLEQALTALGVDHDVKVYPGAGHGFINNPDPADATPLLLLLAKLSGTRYHEASAQDARRRIAAFFSEHLKNWTPPRPPASGLPRRRVGGGLYPTGHASAGAVIRTRVTGRAALRSRSRPWRS